MQTHQGEFSIVILLAILVSVSQPLRYPLASSCPAKSTVLPQQPFFSQPQVAPVKKADFAFTPRNKTVITVREDRKDVAAGMSGFSTSSIQKSIAITSVSYLLLGPTAPPVLTRSFTGELSRN